MTVGTMHDSVKRDTFTKSQVSLKIPFKWHIKIATIWKCTEITRLIGKFHQTYLAVVCSKL